MSSDTQSAFTAFFLRVKMAKPSLFSCVLAGALVVAAVTGVWALLRRSHGVYAWIDRAFVVVQKQDMSGLRPTLKLTEVLGSRVQEAYELGGDGFGPAATYYLVFRLDSSIVDFSNLKSVDYSYLVRINDHWWFVAWH